MRTRALLLLVLAAGLASCQRPEHPLILVGVDGADWAVIDAMIADGGLPNFARLKRQGAWGHLINTGPLSSPVAWTTFSTGHLPRNHGILDFTYPFVASQKKRPVNALDKRRPAIWSIASEAGRSVSVIGYFVTHPAESINGVMISDRAFQNLPGAVSPPEALSRDEIDRARQGPGSNAWIDRFFPWYRGAKNSDDAGLLAAAAYLRGTNVIRHIKREGFVHVQTLKQLEVQPDILVTYYRLPDVIGHTLWKFHDDSDFAESANPTLARFLGTAVRDAYRSVDRNIGEILALARDDTNIVIISDHGMGSATGAYASRRKRRSPITGNHRMDGIILADGPDIRSGRIVEMNNLEVMPTLMALARLPVSEKLPGRIRTDLLSQEFLAENPLRTVPTYDTEVHRGTFKQAPDLVAERETLAALKGLGYVGSDIEASQGLASTDDSIWEIEPRLFADALTGEVLFHVLTGDSTRARAVIQEVAERAPDRAEFFSRQLGMRGETLLNDVPLTDGTRARLRRFLASLQAPAG